MSKNKPLNDRGEKGVIINTSSQVATSGANGILSYTASKGAINGMTLPMARDLGKFGIRVLNIAPGLFITGMTPFADEEYLKEYNKRVPIGRPGEVDDFGKLVKT